MDNISDIHTIVRYFLKLYALHVGAGKDDPAVYRRVDPPGIRRGSDFTYELRIRRNRNWLTRRITIGPIGEQSGSRSRCFKVTYDDLLVIKIPPSPIRSLDDYLEELQPSRRIAEQLASQIVCITPGVAAVLKETPFFSSLTGLSPAKYEQECIKWLRSHDEFQEYVKIDGRFVFFMNLSKHLFLGQVLADMHRIEPLCDEEIRGNADALWEFDRFQKRYGAAAADVGFKLGGVFSSGEKALGDVHARHGLPPLPRYKAREWFTGVLRQPPVDDPPQSGSDAYAADANALAGSLRDRHRELIDAYHQTIRRYVARRNLSRQRPAMQTLVAKLLDLLVRLRYCGVSIRDLKPDNMFVVGDNNRYPQFLVSARDYSIGLIDFETAVSFKASRFEQIPQPMLGGTPSYATPANFVSNRLLLRVYGDLPRILHLQDWQAVMAMLFSVVTGQMLFESTRRVLPGVVQQIRGAMSEADTLVATFKSASRAFWHSAANEFRRQTAAARYLLKGVDVALPSHVCQLMRPELSRQIVRLNERVDELLEGQSIFRRPEQRSKLADAGLQAIRRQKQIWEDPRQSPAGTTAQVRSEMNALWRQLEHLKVQQLQMTRLSEALTQADAVLSVNEILEIMFTTVYKSMYPKRWHDERPAEGSAEGSASAA